MATRADDNWVLNRKHLPNIYFAGSVAPNDWRETVCSGMRNRLSSSCGATTDAEIVEMLRGAHRVPYGGLWRALGGRARFGGPFFIGCDHGCFHTEHGLNDALLWDADSPAVSHRRELIVRLCQDWVRTADAVFAWVDRDDCYGTVSEIGFAAALHIPIYLYEPPENHPHRTLRQTKDMWFMRELATRHRTVPNIAAALASFKTLDLPLIAPRTIA